MRSLLRSLKTILPPVHINSTKIELATSNPFFVSLRNPCFTSSSIPSIKSLTRGKASQGNSPNRSRNATGDIPSVMRSEEHTSELQSRRDLVCRLLLEKKKQKK